MITKLVIREGCRTITYENGFIGIEDINPEEFFVVCDDGQKYRHYRKDIIGYESQNWWKAQW